MARPFHCIDIDNVLWSQWDGGGSGAVPKGGFSKTKPWKQGKIRNDVPCTKGEEFLLEISNGRRENLDNRRSDTKDERKYIARFF